MATADTLPAEGDVMAQSQGLNGLPPLPQDTTGAATSSEHLPGVTAVHKDSLPAAVPAPNPCGAEEKDTPTDELSLGRMPALVDFGLDDMLVDVNPISDDHGIMIGDRGRSYDRQDSLEIAIESASAAAMLGGGSMGGAAENSIHVGDDDPFFPGRELMEVAGFPDAQLGIMDLTGDSEDDKDASGGEGRFPEPAAVSPPLVALGTKRKSMPTEKGKGLWAMAKKSKVAALPVEAVAVKKSKEAAPVAAPAPVAAKPKPKKKKPVDLKAELAVILTSTAKLEDPSKVPRFVELLDSDEAWSKAVLISGIVEKLDKPAVIRAFLEAGGLGALGRWISMAKDAGKLLTILKILALMKRLPISLKHLKDGDVGKQLARLKKLEPVAGDKDNRAGEVRELATATVNAWKVLLNREGDAAKPAAPKPGTPPAKPLPPSKGAAKMVDRVLTKVPSKDDKEMHAKRCAQPLPPICPALFRRVAPARCGCGCGRPWLGAAVGTVTSWHAGPGPGVGASGGAAFCNKDSKR
mmetsp:Transcript_42336/g.135558  ORF Transcript_42336/g.135558 Transcript_42336/m.135558 type:complete len:522 (+) Transcript_42336:649-2214(+)